MIKNFSLLLICLSFFGCAPKKVAKEPRLYLIHSSKAAFSRDPIYDTVGNITMQGVSRSVVYFTPSPEQTSGTIPLTTFLTKWESIRRATKQRPPSTGFLFFEGSGKEFDHISIELVLLGYEEKEDILSVVLKSEGQTFPEAKMELEEVTLFLDMAF